MGFERCHPAVNLIYFTAVIGVRCASGTRWSGHFSLLRLPVQRETQKDAELWRLACVWFLWLWLWGFLQQLSSFWGDQFAPKLHWQPDYPGVFGLWPGIGCTLAGVAMWMSCVYAVFSADKVVYLLGESAPDCPCFYPASSAGTEMWVQARKNPRGSAGHWQGAPSGEHTATLTNGLRIFPYSSPGRWRPWLPHQNPWEPGSGPKDVPPFSIYRFDNRDRGL